MADQIRAALERLLIDIDDLVTESHGVSGLDKNLDPTPWSELLEGGRYKEWLGDAITQARVALATCKRIVAEPTDEELLELTKSWPVTTASRYDLSGCPEVPLYSVFADDVTDFARAVLARWGQRESGSPAVAAVDVEELVAAVAKLRNIELAIWPELLVGWQWRWLGDAIDQAREALVEARLADPADEQLTTHQLLTTDDLRQTWNAQSDQFNGWDELDLDEQLEWAQRQALRRLAPSNLSANVDDVENLAARLMSDAERTRAAEEAWSLAYEAEDLADTLDQGSPEERLLERVATVLRHVVRAIQNPPATEEELNEAREEVADWGPDKIADRISKLGQVQARAGRELSAALCERASQLISASIISASAPAQEDPTNG